MDTIYKIIKSLTGKKLVDSKVSSKLADSNNVSLTEQKQKLGNSDNMSTDLDTNITLSQATLAQDEAAMFAPNLGLLSSCASNPYYTPQPPSRSSHSGTSLPTLHYGRVNCPRPVFGEIQSSVHSNMHQYSHRQATFSQPFYQTMSYPSARDSLNLGDLYGALLPVMDDWKKIGTLLGCNFATLNDIQRRERDDASCLLEMLAERQKIHEPPLSWDSIISAVQPFNSFEAENIRRKHTGMHL